MPGSSNKILIVPLNEITLCEIKLKVVINYNDGIITTVKYKKCHYEQ